MFKLGQQIKSNQIILNIVAQHKEFKNVFIIGHKSKNIYMNDAGLNSGKMSSFDKYNYQYISNIDDYKIYIMVNQVWISKIT